MTTIDEWIDAQIPAYLKESTSIMVMVVDMDGIVRYISDTYIKNFGFSRDTVIGASYQDQIYSGDAERVLSAAERCLNSPGKIEQLLIRKPKFSENAFYFSEWEFSAITDENNTPIGIISIGKLISDTNPLNPIEKDTYFDLINNMTSEAWAFYDKNLRLKVCNQKAIEIAKDVFKVEPIRGDSAFLYVEDQHKKQLEQAYKSALEGTSVQMELVSSLGHHFVITLKPVFDDSNQLLGVGHYCLEVTNIRKSQEEYKKLKRRFQALINQVDGIVLILDLSGNIQYISDTILKYSGFGMDQLLNKNYSEFIHPEDLDELSGALASLKDVNDSVVSIFRTARADGTFFWSLGRGTVLEEGGEKFILSLVLNIDELKQKEEIIKQHHMRFQQIAWLQSHEVRAPLARILGLVETIHDNLIQNPDELKEFLDYIRTSAYELDEVIHKIVRISDVSKSGE